MKKIIALTLAMVCIFAFFGCSKTENTENTEAADTTAVGLGSGLTQDSADITATATVKEDTKYHSATVSLSPEEMEELGFKLGDSVDIAFGNGYSMEDVPFYNGYYVKNGAPVMVAYPGFTNVSITYNNMGIWDTAELTDGTDVTITLNEAGKYSDIQDSLGQQYSFVRDDYDSDEEFCNFRALSGGKLKADFFYRGATPVDNSRGRASYTDGLLKETGIAYVLDLADTEDDMKGYIEAEDFASPYTQSLYEGGKVVLLGMSSSFQSDAYKQKVAEGFSKMIDAEGPVYIHCMEGKDRTGFVCTLLEALAGASYDEMKADYMLTYKNYYKVSAEETPEKYEAIAELYFDAFVSFLHGTEDKAELTDADYTEDAAAYLISGGMTQQEVDSVISFITAQ